MSPPASPYMRPGAGLYIYIYCRYRKLAKFPIPLMPTASLRVVGHECHTPLQIIEVLHLFRWYTHTHTNKKTHTHTLRLPHVRTRAHTHTCIKCGQITPNINLCLFSDEKSISHVVHLVPYARFRHGRCNEPQPVLRIWWDLNRNSASKCGTRKDVTMCVFMCFHLFKVACKPDMPPSIPFRMLPYAARNFSIGTLTLF